MPQNLKEMSKILRVNKGLKEINATKEYAQQGILVC